MNPNSKTLIYDYFFTQYDRAKKEAYIELMYNPINAIVKDKYPSVLFFTSNVIVLIFCGIFGRADLALLTMAMIGFVQFFHIIMSYKSVKRDG